jgi:hypothetical protein
MIPSYHTLVGRKAMIVPFNNPLIPLYILTHLPVQIKPLCQDQCRRLSWPLQLARDTPINAVAHAPE